MVEIPTDWIGNPGWEGPEVGGFPQLGNLESTEIPFFFDSSGRREIIVDPACRIPAVIQLTHPGPSRSLPCGCTMPTNSGKIRIFEKNHDWMFDMPVEFTNPLREPHLKPERV